MLQAQRLGRVDLGISEEQKIHPNSVTTARNGVKPVVTPPAGLDHCARGGDNGQLVPCISLPMTDQPTFTS